MAVTKKLMSLLFFLRLRFWLSIFALIAYAHWLTARDFPRKDSPMRLGYILRISESGFLSAFVAFY